MSSPTHAQPQQQQQQQQQQKPRGIVVFGGGTATNSLVDIFERIREQRGCSLSYVIPISDNGGSSSELIRMFGGPGRLVRLIPGSDSDPEPRALRELFNHRLSSDPEQARMEWLDVVEGRDRRLWGDPDANGNRGTGNAAIPSEKRELIRSIFNLMNLEIVKRARPSSTFNFARASIGNFFLTGARVFTGSLESGIYLLSTICSVPGTVTVLPVINSNFTHHISAGLADGTILAGQNSISHPSAPTSLPSADDHHDGKNNNSSTNNTNNKGMPQLLISPPPTGAENTRSSSPVPSALEKETAAHDLIEDATLPGSLPELRKPYINFKKAGAPRGRRRSSAAAAGGNGSDVRKHTDGTNESDRNGDADKGVENGDDNNNDGEGEGDEEEDEDEDEEEQDLPSRIDRIWYINPYGHEIRPVPNPKVLAAIRGAAAVVYSIGSLYTSIMPSIILRGVGDAIAGVPSVEGATASAAGSAGQQQQQAQGPRYKILILNSANDRETGPRASPFTAADFVRAIARGAGAESRGEYYNRHLQQRSGNSSNTVTNPSGATSSAAATLDITGPTPTPTPTPADQEKEEKEREAKEREEVRRYVTHIIYLESASAGAAIPRVDRDELQRRLGVECVKVYGRRDDPDDPAAMLKYDETALQRALEAIVGVGSGRPTADPLARGGGGGVGHWRRNTYEWT
ncbi:hypothetical protein SLS62_008443 [Diatrype stigma]|uniref:Uncharacterized protein n=1 Tax=Diatrype stigma TaxID=117547 RepID=A0AAN9UMK8_9PEZI